MRKRREDTILAVAYYIAMGSMTPISDACKYTNYNMKTFMNDKNTQEILSPVIKELETIQCTLMSELKKCLNDPGRMEKASGKDIASTLAIVNKEMRLFTDQATENVKHTGINIFIPEEVED